MRIYFSGLGFKAEDVLFKNQINIYEFFWAKILKQSFGEYNLRKQLDWWHKKKAKTLIREIEARLRYLLHQMSKDVLCFKILFATLDRSIFKTPWCVWNSDLVVTGLQISESFLLGLRHRKSIKLYLLWPYGKWFLIFRRNPLGYPVCPGLFNVLG